MMGEPLLDTVIAERFDVLGVAGRGGMGTVYRARHRATGEQVALKIMEASDETRRRFTREASALASMSHPCIVRYRDHGELGDGRVFLAMEWIDGEILGARIRAARMPLRDVLVMCAKLAHALAVVHRHELVHRDVKPGNVMLRSGDALDPVLLDFGLVKPVVGEEITSVGIAVGTPGYMAPEQARGSSRLDARADIFGLACLLFRCATGARPFDGADVTAVLTKLLFDAPPSMRTLEPRITAELDVLVTEMLAKNPEDRPRDATVIAVSLERLAMREAPSQPRIIDQALTPDEQRPVSVVIVAQIAPDAPTMIAPIEESEVLLRPVASPIARAEVVALAESFGGSAETLANGTLVVVFAGNTNARDQCVRAARCALRLKARLPDKVVALASGRARASGGSIVGEAVDRAVLLLYAGEGEGVRAGDASLQLLGSSFEVTRRSGGDASITSERGEALAARTLLGVPTPCVGRDSDMTIVMSTLERCVEDSVSAVVAITADAGVGKSRLASEVIARASLAHPSAIVWHARGDPQLERSPLGLIGKMLRELAHIGSSDSLETRRERLRARVSMHVPAESAATTTEFLGEACGVSFDDDGRPALRAARADPQLMANQLKAAFEHFIVTEAALQPLVIVVEDLHWADALSVSYLERAAQRLATSATLLLVLSRPEGETRFPTLFAGSTHLRLRPLSAKAATKLARAVLGDEAPQSTIERVVDLAAGNAFYLEELIRTVAERQAKGGAGGGRDLPETVVLMTQARLQALDPEARRVLRAASIFGDAFGKDDIAALDGDEKAAAWLDLLVSAEVLVKAQRGTYSFRHALLREAAYASLTDDDRVLGHKLAARRLSARGDRDAMTIAEHYVRGGEPGDAVAAYVRASEQGLDAGDFDAPTLALERAMSCEAEGAVLGKLQGLATRAAWLRGDMPESERLGRQALAKLRPGEPAWYEVIADLGNALQGRLDHAGIEELGRLLLTLPAPKPMTPNYARAISLCYTLVIQNAPSSELALDLTRAIDAVGESEIRGEPVIEARLVVARAFGAIVRREPTVASLFATAARVMDEVGNNEIARMQRNNQAIALGWLGAWPDAVAVLAGIPESAGRAWLWTRVTLAWSVAQLGRLEEAATMLERVLRMGRDDTFLIVETRLTLARVELARGLRREALARAEECLTDASLPKAMVARLHAVAYEAAAVLDAGVARAHGRAVEESLDAGVSFVEDVVYVRLIAALAKREAGNLEGARAVVREAREMILTYAARMGAPEERERYLTDVRENALVLKLSEELGG